MLVADAELTGERVLAELVPLLADPARLATMGGAARALRPRRGRRAAGPIVLDVVGRGRVDCGAPLERTGGATADVAGGDGAELGERVHLIGIGGAGMSGIARILLARGVAVSGSDAKESRAVLALRALGARVEVGHDAANLPADARHRGGVHGDPARPTRSWPPLASAACPWCTGPRRWPR